jgi:hypothetical protein
MCINYNMLQEHEGRRKHCFTTIKEDTLMNERALALKQCLDACQEIEEIASKIYYFNADLFAHNDKISRLWRKTAIEEENHALQIVLAKRIVTMFPEPPWKYAGAIRHAI